MSLSFTAASQGAHTCETRLEINVVLQHKYSKVRCGHKKLNDSKEAKHTAWLLTVCKLEHYWVEMNRYLKLYYYNGSIPFDKHREGNTKL